MIDDVMVFNVVCTVLTTFLLAEVAGLFFIQYQKSREPLSLLLTIVFIGFCASSIFTFVFMFEHQVKKRRFPVLTLLCAVSIIVLIVLPYELAYYFGFAIYGAALVVFWFFLRVYRDTDGKIRRNIEKAILGAFILGLGIGLSADLVVQMGGEYLISVGLIVQLVGLIILGLSFYGIRSTDEFVWYNEAQSLFIIFNSLCIYAYSIEQGNYLKQADLFGGGLASVLMVAQSIVKSDEPPTHIEYQNLNFMVQVGKNQYSENRIIAVLLVKKI
jgi:hypothetical protein